MSGAPELSVVIPAWNEAARLPATLAQLLPWLAEHRPRFELILVDDGSRDATAAILRGAAERDARVVTLGLDRHRGKGAALAAGVAVSRGERLVFTDADLPYPLSAIERALDSLAEGADLAIGTRHVGRRRQGPLRRAASRAFARAVERCFGLGLEDTQCGLKALRGEVGRALFASLVTPGFAFDVELLCLAREWGLRTERVPVEAIERSGSSVRLLPHGIATLRELREVRRRLDAGAYPAKPPPGG